MQDSMGGSYNSKDFWSSPDPCNHQPVDPDECSFIADYDFTQGPDDQPGAQHSSPSLDPNDTFGGSDHFPSVLAQCCSEQSGASQEEIYFNWEDVAAANNDNTVVASPGEAGHTRQCDDQEEPVESTGATLSREEIQRNLEELIIDTVKALAEANGLKQKGVSWKVGFPDKDGGEGGGNKLDIVVALTDFYVDNPNLFQEQVLDVDPSPCSKKRRRDQADPSPCQKKQRTEQIDPSPHPAKNHTSVLPYEEEKVRAQIAFDRTLARHMGHDGSEVEFDSSHVLELGSGQVSPDPKEASKEGANSFQPILTQCGLENASHVFVEHFGNLPDLMKVCWNVPEQRDLTIHKTFFEQGWRHLDVARLIQALDNYAPCLD